MSDVIKPAEDYTNLGVQADLRALNVMDGENPTGGHVNLRIGDHNPLRVQWQDGPRGTDSDGTLGASNGAFIEDVIWAALQRLYFFQSSKYAHEANAKAIEHLENALKALAERSSERAARGVEGQHEV